MRLIFTWITILILGLGVSGQTASPTPPNEKELAKQAKERVKQAEKAQKEQVKAEQKAAEATRKRMTVDFVQVTKFPSTYVGGIRRIAYVGLGDIAPFRDSGMTVYLLRLSSGYDSTAGVFLPEALTFILDETSAQQYVTAIETLKRKDVYSINRTIPGDVYFEIVQAEAGGRRYFGAKVSCIAIYGGFTTSLMASVGECPLVK